MLIFFAIASALNLCVGYVLGVYFGVFPGITRHVILDDGSADNWHSPLDDDHAFALGDPDPHDAFRSSPELNATAELSNDLSLESQLPIDVDTNAIIESMPEDLSALPEEINDPLGLTSSPDDEPIADQIEESLQDELSEGGDGTPIASSDVAVDTTDDEEALAELGTTT